MSDKYTVPSLDRALTVLERLAQTKDLTLGELAGETDIPQSTLFRIMSTLQERKYVSRDEDQKTYRLGLRLIELGRAYLNQTDLLAAAGSYLKRLADTCGESVFLGVLEEEEVVFVRSEKSPKSAILVQRSGQRAPAYCTATGLAILAFRPDGEVEQLLDASDLEAHTPETTTNRAELRRTLETIRETRVAVVDGEYNPALLCVSSPVLDEKGEAVASLTVALLSAQAEDDRIEAVKDKVREAARGLSAERGYAVT